MNIIQEGRIKFITDNQGVIDVRSRNKNIKLYELLLALNIDLQSDIEYEVESWAYLTDNMAIVSCNFINKEINNDNQN